MNIQKINLNQNFSAKIGPNLQAEIREKRKNIFNTENLLGEKELTRINNAEAKIRELLPYAYGSPVTVDIEPVYEKHFINNKYTIKRVFEYVIKNEDETFFYHTRRDNDRSGRTFKYQKLISTLENLETKLKNKNS